MAAGPLKREDHRVRRTQLIKTFWMKTSSSQQRVMELSFGEQPLLLKWKNKTECFKTGKSFCPNWLFLQNSHLFILKWNRIHITDGSLSALLPDIIYGWDKIQNLHKSKLLSKHSRLCKRGFLSNGIYSYSSLPAFQFTPLGRRSDRKMSN